MSSAPRYVPHYTIEDYRRWEGEWELMDGVPVSMSPSPFGPHERVVAELSRQILNQLIENECDCRVYTNLDWIVNDDTVVRPDLMVVCGVQPDRHLEQTPVVVVEVLSDATRQRDLTAKRAIYLEQDVAHYLIVDPTDQTVLDVTKAAEQSVGSGESMGLDLDDDWRIEIDATRLFV
ncbi:hypothetical protein Enr13x_05760 [Stieleria neptunia]|uniref:Putative restriction endonuclease domain-containing protein n=1 Tax=Stieleria neptunia TaxID=2527979 RepID=A0A518HIW5_9BACT|nr:Uma2 family endonuclease [Stieleria neptunia]QDV40740.1 hypothetical protein Enr13x_05760 [Stieleria neptunia]